MPHGHFPQPSFFPGQIPSFTPHFSPTFPSMSIAERLAGKYCNKCFTFNVIKTYYTALCKKNSAKTTTRNNIFEFCSSKITWAKSFLEI